MNYFNYFSEIEETFVRRRGRNLLLSPLDWALIESWQERNIPLNIVIRAIETVFDGVDKKPKTNRTVKSLFYCKEEIEAQYAEWLEMQVGKNGVEIVRSENQNLEEQSENSLFSAETIENHFVKITEELNSAKSKAAENLRETLEVILRRLFELKKSTKEAEKLEETLEKLDSLIDESLLKTFEEKTLSEIEAKVSKQLASYKTKMEPDVYQRTFDLMLLKHLRERAEVPRLSLFYL